MGIDTLDFVCHIYKRDNNYDFLFALLCTRHLKTGRLQKKWICYLWDSNPFFFLPFESKSPLKRESRQFCQQSCFPWKCIHFHELLVYMLMVQSCLLCVVEIEHKHVQLYVWTSRTQTCVYLYVLADIVMLMFLLCICLYDMVMDKPYLIMLKL